MSEGKKGVLRSMHAFEREKESSALKGERVDLFYAVGVSHLLRKKLPDGQPASLPTSPKYLPASFELLWLNRRMMHT